MKALLFCLAVVAGCTAPRAVLAPPAACILSPVMSPPADTLRTFFDDPLPFFTDHADAPVLFRQAENTLITVDCLGVVRAGLATKWGREDEGRDWTFKLRDRLRDGTPISARSIVDYWRRAPEGFAGIDSVAVEGKHAIRIFFKNAQPAIPRWLGTVKVRASSTSAVNADPVLFPVHLRGRDVRDLLGENVDVMVTRDPDVIAYARVLSQMSVHALPWDRTYVLAARSSRLDTARIERNTWGDSTALSGLVEAIRADARPSEAAPWLETRARCGTRDIRENERMPVRRIVYSDDDEVARDLAERLVALASMTPEAFPESWLKGSEGLVSEGVSPEMILSRFSEGGALVVLAVPLRALDPCAGWDRLNTLVGEGIEVLPLVDTRPYAIIRKGRVGLAVDGSGRLIILNEPR